MFLGRIKRFFPIYKDVSHYLKIIKVVAFKKFLTSDEIIMDI